MDNEQSERHETNYAYQSPPQTIQPPAPIPPSSSPKRRTGIIIALLTLLLVAALATIAYLLLIKDHKPAASTLDSTQVEQHEDKSADSDITKQVQKAIKNPKPLQSFSYEGWEKYPEDAQTLFKEVKYPPTGQTGNEFGPTTFSFPSHWRYVSGIDMQGIASRPWYLGEPDQRDKPSATLTFGWWPTDNSNGFEDAVLSRLKNIISPGSEPNAQYTHTLREIGMNSQGKMVAIIDYSYHYQQSISGSTGSSGVLGIVDDVHPTYSYSNGVSLASSGSKLAADPYQGAKQILSVIQCAGENITDTQLTECIGIIKSYDRPNTSAAKQAT